MKTITINRLTLENFKCHSHLTLELGGRSASIYGDNATGKTSIYDAFVWLLFGKDSLGSTEKVIDIKPLNAGGAVRDHQAITAVEAELSVDGKPETFRRACREVWTKHRGSDKAVYEGSVCDYFVGGIPVRKNVYDAAVRELVAEDVFRMLTSVSCFAANMKWQDRRAILFDMALILTDRELMAQEPRFADLADRLGEQTLSAHREKLQRKKKGLTGIRQEAPARLSECRRLLQELEEGDWNLPARAEEPEEPIARLRQALDRQLMEQGAALARQAMADRLGQRIQGLEADADAAQEALAAMEKTLFDMEEFTRFKAKFAEESVNSLFRIAAFRLFREQANGALEERCDAQYGGVPYPSLNNAMKINVGIDIINALSCHYGVRVPLFIDNAEAVTHLEDSGTQVIRLVVSPADPALRIE